jgi:p-hydroxybenzoate 3-monooxygenase
VRTQIGIVGAGPAGLVLAHLLHQQGVESIVLESHTRQYCEERVRAGLLEQGTVDLLKEMGAGERLGREGLTHFGIEILFHGHAHRINFKELAGGRSVTIYPQQKILQDLFDIRTTAGLPTFFEVENVSLHNFHASSALRPSIRFRHNGASEEVTCDFIAGCDGFHGVSRDSVPAEEIAIFDRVYPFGWLGILAEAPPASEELVYAYNERGFALLTMRSRELSRLYLQCAPDDDIHRWSDRRIWDELHIRLERKGGWKLTEGAIVQKGITPMRSFVIEPMQFGNLFIAGDAAHIVPPTGAKGLNLAVADVRVLAPALVEYYKTGKRDLLDRYSEVCLRRVWQVQRFSWWMTSMLHTFDDASPFDRRRQIAELEYVTSSRAAAQTLAENYVGLPMT